MTSTAQHSASRGKLYWLASYPKSGNTWVRIFIANLQSNSSRPLCINSLTVGGIASNRHWLENLMDFDISELSQNEIERLRPVAYQWYSQQLHQPEYRKIHDAYTFLPDGTPLIPPSATRGALCIIRNPLDVAVSFAHHHSCTVDETIACMANSHYALCDNPTRFYRQLSQRLLSWSKHVLSWVDAKNIRKLVLRYEDLKMDPSPTFAAIADFLELPCESARVKVALQHSDIQTLQAQEAIAPFRERNPHAKSFFRRGEIGDWQEALTKKQVNTLIRDHGEVMYRFGYLDADGSPSELITQREIA